MSKQQATTISVVIPLYNKANAIAKTLQTVCQQRTAPMEIIVVDDGSSDNGINVVEALNIANLRIIQQTNQGVSAARNTGIDHARGTHIAFLDADDLWQADYLTQQSKLIKVFPQAGLYATGFVYQDHPNTTTQPKIRMAQTAGQAVLLDDFFAIGGRGELPFFTSSVVMSKAILQDIGGFPVGESMGEDQEVWCQAALHHNIAYCAKPQVIYNRIAENRACQMTVTKEECGFSKRLTQYAMSTPLKLGQRHQLLAYCASHLLHLSALNCQQGNLRCAINLLLDGRCLHRPIRALACALKILQRAT